MLSSLFAAHYRDLVRLAALIVDDRDLAEDVVQEAFTTAARRWLGIRDPDRALYYLRAAVANGGRDQLRHRRVVRSHEGDLIAQVQPAAEVAAVDRATHDAVYDELSRLSTRQRQVLVLRYYLDYSEAQIADCLGISRGAVKAHASRGIAALSSAMEVWR